MKYFLWCALFVNSFGYAEESLLQNSDFKLQNGSLYLRIDDSSEYKFEKSPKGDSSTYSSLDGKKKMVYKKDKNKISIVEVRDDQTWIDTDAFGNQNYFTKNSLSVLQLDLEGQVVSKTECVGSKRLSTNGAVMNGSEAIDKSTCRTISKDICSTFQKAVSKLEQLKVKAQICLDTHKTMVGLLNSPHYLDQGSINVTSVDTIDPSASPKQLMYYNTYQNYYAGGMGGMVGGGMMMGAPQGIHSQLTKTENTEGFMTPFREVYAVIELCEKHSNYFAPDEVTNSEDAGKVKTK